MNDTAIEPKTSIDLERLAAMGRQVIDARNAELERDAVRRENERREDLLNAWSPFVMDVLEAIKKWLPSEHVTIGNFRVAGPGWTITIPDDNYPYRGGNYLPVALKLDGCMTINCFSNKEGSVVFDPGKPGLLFNEEEGQWYVHEEFSRWANTWGDFSIMNGDLTVAIARARDGFLEKPTLMAEADRRNLNCILPKGFKVAPEPDPEPERVDYLKEAKRFEEMLSKINGPSDELFQSGVLAALIAIGEELRIRHY